MKNTLIKILTSTLVAATVIGGGVVASASPLNNEPIKTQTSISKTITGNVSSNIVQTFNKDQITPQLMQKFNKLTKEFKNFKVINKKNGQVELEVIRPTDNLDLYINNKKVSINKNGEYSTQVTSNKANIELKANNEVLLKKTINVDKKDNKENINADKNFAKVMKPMDTKASVLMSQSPNRGVSFAYAGQYDGEPLYAGEHVHCDRMNGPESDHIYHSEWHPSAWLDFVGSDCYDNAVVYHCGKFAMVNNECDGLGVYGTPHDCSQITPGLPVTVWWRN